MPVKRGKDSSGSFYRWGSGKKYYYTVNDSVSRTRAKNRARLQERAARANGYKGAGILDHLPRLREGAPPLVRNWVAKKGSLQIINIQIWRNPLTSTFRKILNLITLGQFNREAKRLNYDDIYHLYMVLYFADGSRLRVDKNHVVEITDRIAGAGTPGTRMNAGNPKCDLATFFNRGESVAGGPRPMWVYSAVAPRWNCQAFVTWCLKGSGLLTGAVDKFVNQDAESLVKASLPRKFLGAVTGLAGRADSVLHGKGLKKRK